MSMKLDLGKVFFFILLFGRGTKSYLTDASQKGGVGDIYDILRKQAQENRVTDTPNLFVGIHK